MFPKLLLVPLLLAEFNIFSKFKSSLFKFNSPIDIGIDVDCTPIS